MKSVLRALACIAALSTLAATTAYSAPGDLVQGFGDGGRVFANFSGAFPIATPSAVRLGDGRFAVGGAIPRVNYPLRIYPFESDGSLIPYWSDGFSPGTSGPCHAAMLAADPAPGSTRVRTLCANRSGHSGALPRSR